MIVIIYAYVSFLQLSSFIQQKFIKRLNVPGTVLGAEDVSLGKIKMPELVELMFWWGETGHKQG